MSLRSKFTKVKTQGYLRTLELLFNRFVPPWVFRFSMGDIYEFDIEKLISLEDKNRKDASSPLVPKVLNETDSRMKLRSFTWNTVPLETTHNDLAFGVYDAEESDQPLAGLWAGVESFLEENLGIEFQFENQQAWLYCAYVDPSTRGKGVYKCLISFAAKELKQRGYTCLLGIVQPWNKVSRRMHEQQSLRVCGRMTAIRVLFWVWISYRGDLQVDKRLVTNIATQPAKVRIL